MSSFPLSPLPSPNYPLTSFKPPLNPAQKKATLLTSPLLQSPLSLLGSPADKSDELEFTFTDAERDIFQDFWGGRSFSEDQAVSQSTDLNLSFSHQNSNYQDLLHTFDDSAVSTKKQRTCDNDAAALITPQVHLRTPGTVKAGSYLTPQAPVLTPSPSHQKRLAARLSTHILPQLSISPSVLGNGYRNSLTDALSPAIDRASLLSAASPYPSTLPSPGLASPFMQMKFAREDGPRNEGIKIEPGTSTTFGPKFKPMPSKRKRSPKKADRLRRPMNAFILWAKQLRVRGVGFGK